MSDRFPGGVISKTPPTVTGPATSGPLAGEGGSASGVWSLEEVLGYQKAGVWPKPILPRELYAWGKGNQGQLGNNTDGFRSSPVQIGLETNWSLVSVWQHTLGIQTDGGLYAWGTNSSGQLGDNTTVSKSSPIQVGGLSNWSDASAGGSGAFSVATKTDGTLWAWGGNGSGQLGDGTTVNKSSPIQIGSDLWSIASSGDETVIALTIG